MTSGRPRQRTSPAPADALPGTDAGDIVADGRNVNQEMIAAGMAWHFTRYLKDKALARAEAEARAARRGLWADKDPMPPWEWRANKTKDRSPGN